MQIHMCVKFYECLANASMFKVLTDTFCTYIHVCHGTAFTQICMDFQTNVNKFLDFFYIFLDILHLSLSQINFVVYPGFLRWEGVFMFQIY